ncbi:TonB-dependent receptor domain-containing protein [Phenylobacterium sp.]|uniref:TonB-dependent receptor plug domain-containing protein n=1 Tax=Phenylobacterium sp. TaxID=1871053 RepID=UPI0028127561|nr:TonB-dependent receptor [Phenylobacterium sp.]
MLRTTLLASAAAAAALTAPTFAAAQTAGDVAVDEIVVTGSRIRRDTFSTPQPLSVVSAEAIRQSGNVAIGDVLLEQPNINPATNQQNSSGTLFLAGQTRADIRGIGPTRTLVLMDNRRLPFSDASSPGVDLNTIPSLMVERIETIAGGASAVYGSEAISGVVNFIMKKEQDGLEVDIQGGIAQEGDGEEFRFGFNWGGKFLDDRLNVLIGGEYANQDKIMQKDRDELYPGIRRDSRLTPQTIIPNSRSNTSPYATFQLTGGALGTARAVTLDVRNPTQVVRLSAACSTPTVQPDCQDEALFYSTIYNTLQAKSNRGILRTYVDYALTENIKIFGDVTYVKGSGYGIFQPAFSSAAGGGTMPVVLRGDNAFLNNPNDPTATALRAEWLAAGKTFTQGSTAQVGKFWQEFGGRDVKTEREQIKLLAGFEGDFEVLGRGVNWEVYGQYSELDGKTTSYGVPNVSRVQQATDAVMLNGQIVCRDANARAAGCVPWNLINGASREAVLWTSGIAVTDQRIEQSIAGASLSFDLFELPAGPVGFAAGLEAREEKSAFFQDPISASGALFFNAIGTREGQFDVVEGFAEVRVPLLKDVFLADELSVELAGRRSNYSTIGLGNQWRAVLNWAPIKDIRFRASEATAIRAPNIVELYSPQGRNFTTTAVDPCDRAAYAGASAAQRAARNVTCAAAIPGWNPATFESNFGPGRSSLALLQGGNPDLNEERAHTYQYGVVLQPRFIPNLQISVDFFKYNIRGQVGTIPINTLLQALCYDDASTPYDQNQYCAQIIRDPTGTAGSGRVGGVVEIIQTNQNVASVKVEGYDYSVAYGFRTEDLFQRDYGDIALRLDATWMYQFQLQGLPGQAYTQLANTINNATPEWKANFSARWTYNDLSLTWSTLYFGSMIANNAFQPNQLDPYMTGDYFRHDLRGSYRVNDQITVRAGIINLFDEYPPEISDNSIFTGTGTGSSQYDNRGRFFFIGANMNF